MTTPRPRAFTLIELIVVIVILGVLAALAVPTFRNSQQQAAAGTLHTSAQARSWLTTQPADRPATRATPLLRPGRSATAPTPTCSPAPTSPARAC